MSVTKSGYALVDCGNGCGRAIALPRIEVDKVAGWVCPACEAEQMAEALIAQTERKLEDIKHGRLRERK